MITDGEAPRDLARLVVPQSGSLEATGDLFQPYRLIDAVGVEVVPAAAWFPEDSLHRLQKAAEDLLVDVPCCDWAVLL